jgi:hypothetical protein
MKTFLGIFLILVSFSSVRYVLAEGSSIENIDYAVADNFADAFQQADIVVGVYEMPIDLRPVVLPSGEYLENSSEYSETTIRYNLSKLCLVSSITTNAPPYIFTSSLHVRREGHTISPFQPLPGSKWILALRHFTNEFIWIDAESANKLKPSIIAKNWFQPFNGRLGYICQYWPTNLTGGDIAYLKSAEVYVNPDEAIVEDLHRIYNFMDVRKNEKVWTIEDALSAWEIIKTNFGKTVLERIIRSKTAL